MAAEPNFPFLFGTVDKTLATLVPLPLPQHDKLYKSIGVISHGTIEFTDKNSNKAKFIRIPPDANVSHVKELLNNEWCNKHPPLVISITGGAKDYNMKPKLLRAFQRGLLKVARTTGAWIVTGGMNTGVMKLVGDSLQLNQDRSRPVHLIGIATWGCVANRDQLNVRGTRVNYSKPRSEQKGEAPLQPNHTEFIFVDDGTERKYGGEIPFRARLEEALSGGFFGSKPTNSTSEPGTSLINSAAPRSNQSRPIPVVLIVVEGGPNTVRTVHEAVVLNSIPAVIIDGTGRCCNLFAKAYRLYDDYREKFELTRELNANLDTATFLQRFEDLKKKMREDLTEELGGISGESSGAKTPRKGGDKGKGDRAAARPADTADYFELVYECIHTRQNFLNIVSLNSRNPIEPDIDLAILQALLKATSGSESGKTNIQQKQEQLRLALEWNRADIAQHYIMKGEREWEKIVSNEFFATALHRNQLAFVKLFLDNDFSLSTLFGDNEMFCFLYRNVIKESQRLEQCDEPLRLVYEEKIQPLIGDFFDVNVVFKATKQTTRNTLTALVDEEAGAGCFANCCRSNKHSARGRRSSNGSAGSMGQCGNRLDLDKELFLWSLITGRREFAMEFWSRGRNKICAALIATLIFKKVAHVENDNSYLLAAAEYESLAVQILDKFYQTHTIICSDAIIRRIPDYGDVTWLELAVAAEAKEFIAHRAVQDILNNIWFGHIDQHVRDWKIIFSTVMLWYSGFLPYDIELVKPNETSNSMDDPFNRKYLLQRENSQSRSTFDRGHEALPLKLLDDIHDQEEEDNRFAAVGCWEKTVRKVSQYFSNILIFMRAPYVKYLYNLYFHVIFLLLFSYVILCDFFPLYDFPPDICSARPKTSGDHDQPGSERKKDESIDRSTIYENDTTNGGLTIPFGMQRRKVPSASEFVLFVWIVTLVLEEIRQLVAMEAQSTKNAVVAYFQVFWNKLDVLAIILFFIGFSLRFINNAECFCAARIVLSVDLAIWFMRSLDIFAAVKRLGPKLVMISEMVHDLKFFMIMLTVFILAFGVSSYSLIYGVQQFSWHLPRRIINLAYWQIFGELNALEEFEDNYQAYGYTAFILLVAYMAIVSILLVNLLIAMFSNTFDRLQTDTDRIWKFQRYSLVCEYLSRPALPPPFILFSHIWRFTLYVLHKCCKSDCVRDLYHKHQERTKYKKTLEDEKLMESIEMGEDAIGDEVYFNWKLSRKLIDRTVLDEEQIQSPQENMLNKIRSLENRIQTMSTQQVHMFEYLECLMEGLKAMGGDRIRVPERRRFDPEESLINTQVDDEPLLMRYHHPGYHSI